MAQYTFTIDIPRPDDVAKIVNSAVLPRITQAVEAIANQARYNWQRAVYDARLWSGEKTPYMESITMRMTGPFSAVVESDYQYADEIETGRPTRDLKKMLDTSTKVRRTKDGRRFLVIPMQHNTTANDAHAPPMPPAIGKIVAGLAHSSVTSSGTRPAGEVTLISPKTGMQAADKQSPYLSSHKTGKTYLVPKHDYAWGERIKPSMLKGQSAADKKKYAGMVKMKEASGGSSYLTFRVMMEGSSGWVVPAKPGLYLAKKVVDDLQPLADKALAEAFKRTFGA
jgi:hypothetical protein